MRVLQISKFYPPVLGGIETVAGALGTGLNRHGVRTDVLCANHRLLTRHETAGSGYDVWRAGSFGSLLSTSMAWAMPGLLARRRTHYDMLHVHMPDPMAAAAVYLSRPRLPLVLHWHSDVIRQRWALRLYEPLQRWLLERADAIVATSPAYAESSEPLRPWRHKVRVVPIGIDDNRQAARPERVEELRRLWHGRRIVFALGRMTYYKGFDVLIDAAERLGDDCVVVIGGEGELLESYRARVARAGLAGKVVLPGALPDHDLPSYFQACDVFCMPSTVRAEAYGVAIVEAMVMGRPIVATDIEGSGVPWVNRHGETGLNVRVGDPGALAAALNGLLADAPLREQMGQRARQRFEAEFHADLMTRRMLDLYRGLLPR